MGQKLDQLQIVCIYLASQTPIGDPPLDPAGGLPLYPPCRPWLKILDTPLAVSCTALKYFSFTFTILTEHTLKLTYTALFTVLP